MLVPCLLRTQESLHEAFNSMWPSCFKTTHAFFECAESSCHAQLVCPGNETVLKDHTYMYKVSMSCLYNCLVKIS
jgi:hypothetical protein